MQCKIIPFPNPELRRPRHMMPATLSPFHAPRVAAHPTRHPDGRIALALLDKLHRGVVMMTADATPLFMNRAAKTMLSRGETMALSAGRLTLHDRKARYALEVFLDRSRCEDSGTSETLVLRVDHTNMKPPYRLLAMRLDDANASDLSPVFGLFIYEPHGGRFIPTRVLTDLYGLSRAEARFAAELFQGCSVQQAALRLGIAVNTAKTHLKHVFAKCEVRSQSELLQLLALGPRTW